MLIINLDSTPSTNIYLKELLNRETVEEGTFVMATDQTAGRGQAGNSWESERGQNLTFSFLLRPQFLALQDYFLLSKAISLGIKAVLDKYIGPVAIKWPNDLYYNDRKICGILFENEIIGSVIAQSVVGIGLNVNQVVFRSDAPNPISIRQITGEPTDLAALMAELAVSLMDHYQLVKENQYDRIDQAYHAALYRRSGVHLYQDKQGSFYASIDEVDNRGIFHLTTDQGEKRSYAFKEVAIPLRR